MEKNFQRFITQSSIKKNKMHGFSIIISTAEIKNFDEFKWKKPFEFQHDFILRKNKHTNLYVEQFTSLKFLSEKLWIDNDNFFIVTEGIITNLNELCEKYSFSDAESLLNYLINLDMFFNHFRGNFCGFVYNKIKQTYKVFNNQTGTKKLFCFTNSDVTAFGTDLYTLHEALKSLKIKTTPDIEAAYLLLSNGFMLGNLTLIRQIKQIRAGEYAEIKNYDLTIKTYFHLSGINKINSDKNKIVEKIETLFSKAIQREYDIDTRHGKTSLSTLSGGLDSRMTTLTAFKKGYFQELISFSEKGYADEIIAKQIAKIYRIKLQFYPLNPKGLCKIDDVVLVNDGLTLYSSASHVFDAFSKINSKNQGIVHTGMIGDAVFGSFLSAKTVKRPNPSMGIYAKGLYKKSYQIILKYLNEYKTEELYKFYTRAFSGANNGFLYYDLIGESLSPFLDVDFLTYVLSIPEKYRYKERIYIVWIKAKHPDASNFIWENIGCKPTNNTFIKFIFRLKRAIVKRLPIQTMWKNNMTPEQLWYNQDKEVRNYLDNYFENNIQRVDFNSELRNDLTKLYNEGNITEKTQVLTLLAAYKLHFS